MEGVETMREQREGKITLRSHEVEDLGSLNVGEQARCSGARLLDIRDTSVVIVLPRHTGSDDMASADNASKSISYITLSIPHQF
jgi:hypothetical protein